MSHTMCATYLLVHIVGLIITFKLSTCTSFCLSYIMSWLFLKWPSEVCWPILHIDLSAITATLKPTCDLYQLLWAAQTCPAEYMTLYWALESPREVLAVSNTPYNYLSWGCLTEDYLSLLSSPQHLDKDKLQVGKEGEGRRVDREKTLSTASFTLTLGPSCSFTHFPFIVGQGSEWLALTVSISCSLPHKFELQLPFWSSSVVIIIIMVCSMILSVYLAYVIYHTACA